MRKQQLDGLRFLAFMIVFLFHGGQHHVASWFDYGKFGTDLFFALSGFLITRLLLENSGGSVFQEIRTFYARRTLRIFPLYYAYLAILFLSNNLKHAAWYFFYVFNIGYFLHDDWKGCVFHLWTLSVEEQYYLFYPMILLSTPPKWRLLMILVLLTACEIFTWKMWTTQSGPWYMLTPTRTPLMWGSLAAIIDLKFPQKWLKGGAIFAIGFAISLLFLYLDNWKIPLPWSYWAIYYPFQPMAFALVVWGLWRAESKILLAPFTLPPIAYLGKISYGLYIFHATNFHLRLWLMSFLPVVGQLDPMLFVFTLTVAQAAFWCFNWTGGGDLTGCRMRPLFVQTGVPMKHQ